jgi:hypothetical protein
MKLVTWVVEDLVGAPFFSLIALRYSLCKCLIRAFKVQ